MSYDPNPPRHRIDPIVQQGIDLDKFAKALLLIALEAPRSPKRKRRPRKTSKKSQPPGKKGEQL